MTPGLIERLEAAGEGSRKERPMLFSAPMVRALLAGRKTQTRRIVKPMPQWAERFPICAPDNMAAGHQIWWWDGEYDRVGVSQDCPYGAPGDRLWVKESGLHKRGPLFELFIHDASPDCYWASPDHGGEKLTPQARGKRGAGIGPALTRDQHKGMGFKARPSIHMPRWASRLTLEITEVRVERLQDISDADAQAEGLEWVTPGMWSVDRTLPIIGDDARKVYFDLWDHINGSGSAAENPWVWVVSFAILKARATQDAETLSRTKANRRGEGRG